MDIDLVAGYVQGSPNRGSLLSNSPHRHRLTTAADGDNDRQVPSQVHVHVTRASKSNQLGLVISKIEDIFESITDCLLDEKKELVIQLKSRSKSKSKSKSKSHKPQCEQDDDDGDGDGEREKSRMITFPSKNAKEAWKFTALLRILELSHEALVTGIVTTKRLNAYMSLDCSIDAYYYPLPFQIPKIDIYYREPELFMKQAVVDRYVDDIAYTFGVNRDALNVMSQSLTSPPSQRQGLLIPNPSEISTIQFLDVRWILVIEKEATFRTLASAQYWQSSLAGRGILLTAKGYPDIQTRQFLHLLSTCHPSIAILALVDFDPDGIGIMATYKHGSQSLAHEQDLAVPSVRWLGVRSGDIGAVGVGEGEPGLLRLSARDRRVAVRMLERGGQVDAEWMRELRVMLVLNVKAEIQILGGGGRLAEWLDEKLLDAV
ncbi:meiosis-specific topoisomerase Spo11 [Drepanopeziza brunnea f. sp. 'multigermtubi' MB_m1]|uniref:DNA topoisomerase (ATP-hydrolyzing) n=1 Tax=Marssonina brunnea f. sp. multigermtubi (strain MB_m1) TaxID=1072389 RepID=K1XEX7_MARBU|nr:meiosis-specific topoisomerase Spo11 [Drepanopeziza brunnea f. sp. 'multigermtubi' MB_m1]EKD19458.1 meiosis-specific topoisomerase Spo11 [Drepanopeziza brunnea f. sp. 'multigermtubi' MB_m1]